MRKVIPFLLLLVMVISSLACSFGSQPEAAPTPVKTDINEPEAPQEAPETTQAELPASSAAVSALAPGFYAFTNANVVRDLTVYDGVIHTATLGGLVTWRLDSGYPMQYTPLDGMGHVSANAITYCEIPEPRILVGTLNGISIYDPKTGLWDENTLLPEDHRVNSSKIERLYCDQPNNRLLIGYYGLGVLDLSNGEFQQYTEKEGLLWNSVSDITVAGKDIWIASSYKGVARLSNGTITPYSAANGMPDERAYSLAVGKDGTLWVGASSGLLSFKNNQWTLFGKDTTANLSGINELEISSDGKLWAATAPLGSGRLCQFDPTTATCEVELLDADNQAILALALSEDGKPIIGTSKGVSVLENGSFKPFKTEDQLVSNYVDSFALSPDGMLWVGTDAGIQVISPDDPNKDWITYRQSDIPEMGGSWAKAMVITPDSSVWIAMTNGRASRYQNGVWSSYEEIYSYDSVAVDAQNRIWFGDDSKGIMVLNADGSQAMSMTSAEGLPGDNVQALLADSEGRMWIGTNQGLAKFENDTLEVVFGKDSKEIPNVYIRDLAMDENGALLIGTFTGVARYNGNQVETLIDFLKDGFQEARLTTLAVSPNGDLFAGTDKGLLTSADMTTWTMLTTRDGLMTNYVSALTVDSFGAIWVGGGGSNFDGGGLLQIVR